jgi:hypothetical protein
MNYTWYLIVSIISLIVGQITGYLRGLKDGKEIFGTLRMDHSDIEEPPYLFLELKGHTVDDISRQTFVTFAVEQKDFLPRN